MTDDITQIIRDLREVVLSDDHDRGCMGRCYSCSCGYDDRKDKLATTAAAALERLSAVSAAADVLERIAKENCADPAIDNLTVPLAIKLSEALHAKDAAEARLEEMQKVCDSYAAENQRFHDRFTAAEARLAELSAVTATWQPIETAPKDGTRIIVDWGGTVVTAYYLDNSKATHFPWEGWKVPSMEKWPKGKPTHWQPMPIPVSVAAR